VNEIPGQRMTGDNSEIQESDRVMMVRLQCYACLGIQCKATQY